MSDNTSATAHPSDRRALEGLMKLPHMRSVLLLSSDGMPRTALGLTGDQADDLATTVSGLFSLARATTQVGDGHQTVRQVLVELDEHLMFITAAGEGAVLAVVTGHDASPDQIGFEVRKLVAARQRSLATPGRTTETA